MRRLETAVAALALVMVVGCSGDAPAGVPRNTAPSLSASEAGASQAQGESRRIRGSCNGSIVSIVPLSPTTAREVVTAVCQISHLGRTTFYLQQTINFATLVGTSEVLTFTAANGDVLWATSLTTGTPGPTPTLTGTFTFIGGTGRFARASGSADFTGTANFATGAVSIALSGRITYGASDHAEEND